MSHTERLLFIDRKIRSGGSVTVADVEKKFEVSSRQVKRDIEYLRYRLDAPIIYDASIRAYRYEKKFTDLEFADQNLVTSYLALLSIAQNHDYMPVYAENMLQLIKEEVPADYHCLCDKISYQIPLADSIKPEFFEDICFSMRDSKCLDIIYTNLKGEESCRRIEPMRLLNYGGSWYVISYDTGKKAIRNFHLSRITSISVSDKKFEKHSQAFMKEVESFVSSGFGIFHGQKTSVVKLRFFNQAMRIVQTQTWHKDQKVTKGSEGESEYIELSFPAADFTEVLYKLLSFGSNAKPVYPEELVKLWKAEINKLYDSVKKTSGT